MTPKNQKSQPLVLAEWMRQSESMPPSQFCLLEPDFKKTVHPWPDKVRDRERIDPAVREQIRGAAAGELPWPILLWGEAGSGKSCAALCALDHFGGLYLEASLFADFRRMAMAGELWEHGYRVFEAELWKPVRQANLVVVDELGVREKVTDHQYESVKRIMDNRDEKPAIYVSNLSPAALARVYDDRIASRATAGTVIAMAGDRRQRS